MRIRKRQTSLPVNQTTKPKWTIREATIADAASVAESYNHYVMVGGSTFDRDPWSPSDAAAYIESEPPEAWFVADTSSAIVGWASIRQYSVRDGYRLSYETAIYLSPASLGTGVADALQHCVDNYFCQRGLHHAVAKIIADNQRSIAFHIRHGYELVGVQKEIGRMDERWIDVAILQKIYR